MCRARGAGDQEHPALLPLFDPAGFCGHHGSAVRTTTASQGPVFYTARQPPWRPRHLTGTSVLREALKFPLLYPTFYIEFTIPRHDVYLLYVNSIRLQIKLLGKGMAALQ